MRFCLSVTFGLIALFARADRFDDFVKAAMQDQGIPGLQFAVVYKGKVVMARAYGVADVDQKVAVTGATTFQIASMSKPILATAVMMLWEQKRFKLEDSVGKYVSGLPAAWNRVPIGSLLSHTSGIPEFLIGPAYRRQRTQPTPFEEILRAVRQELDFDPNDHFAYSNTNYLLLGKLIESLTGKPYTEFVRANIFAPLGMASSSFVGAPTSTKGYFSRRGSFAAATGSSLDWAGPGASIVSTATDLAKFDEALLSQRLVKNATQNLMLAKTPTKFGPSDYGMGWQVAKIGKNTVAAHSGKMNGFSSVYLRLIEDRISVILLTNGGEIDGNTLSRGILGLYFPDMAPLDLTPIVDDSPETTRAHFGLVTAIVRGDIDPAWFTAQYRERVSEEKLKAVGTELRRGGRIEPLKVLRRFRKGDFDVHAYLLVQGKTEMILTLFVDDAGKIGGLTFAAP